MKILRIDRWDELYETSETRKIKRGLSFVKLPTCHGGKAFRRLMRNREAGRAFAGWILMLQTAARCSPRGYLIDDKGKPLDADDLEDLTGLPAEDFRLAIEVLTDPRISWVVAENGDPRRFGKISRENVESPGDRGRIPGDSVESSGDPPQTETETEIKAQAAAPLSRSEDRDRPKGGAKKPPPIKWTTTGFTGITPSHLAKWAKAYPRLNLKAEIASADRWLSETPRKARRMKDFGRFLGSWLRRSSGDLDAEIARINGANPRRLPAAMAAAEDNVDRSLQSLGDLADAQDAEEAALQAASEASPLYRQD